MSVSLGVMPIGVLLLFVCASYALARPARSIGLPTVYAVGRVVTVTQLTWDWGPHHTSCHDTTVLQPCPEDTRAQPHYVLNRTDPGPVRAVGAGAGARWRAKHLVESTQIRGFLCCPMVTF